MRHIPSIVLVLLGVILGLIASRWTTDTPEFSNPTTEWTGTYPAAVRFVDDTNSPSYGRPEPAGFPRLELGLRSDGVLVWRVWRHLP